MSMSESRYSRLLPRKKTLSKLLSLERLKIRKHHLMSQGPRLTILSSIEDSVREDVAMLKASPFINKETQIVGLKYDIFTGELSVVGDN